MNRPMIAAGCIIASCLSLGACARNRVTWHEDELFAMDTYMTCKVLTDREDLTGELKEEILRVEKLLSVQDPDSEISRINASTQVNVPITSEVASLLGQTLEICRQTDGALNIAMYPLSLAWGFTSDAEEQRVPEPEEALAIGQMCDISGITVEGDQICGILEDQQLDLGAVGKGYVTDTCVEILRKAGCENAILSFGGNVYGLGRNTEKDRPWNVAIQNPRDETGVIGTIAVENQAVVTSGDYQRYFEEDGIRYCHILDPETCAPSDNGLASVTIISDRGLIADGLSTALFVMGEETGRSYWKMHQDEFSVIWVTDDLKVYATNDLREVFSPAEGVDIVWVDG